MRPGHARRVLLGLVVVGALTGSLSGCAQRDPAPAPTSPVTPRASATAGTTTGAATSSPGASATSALPGMPVPSSEGPSPVDASAIHSLDDLAAAFGCPRNVTPITIPAVTTPPPAAPPVTSGTVTLAPKPRGTGTVTPPVLVCGSGYAKGEALYLWYAPTPQDKLTALKAALATTKYVHGGPTWVAGGTVDPAMGTVGGEVYR